jgi:hypothetical protein
MSTAQQALSVARAAGVLVHLDGEDLVLEALAVPPADVLDILSLPQVRYRDSAASQSGQLVS